MPAKYLARLPWLALIGALLAVAGNLFGLPALVYAFKPATTLLIIAWAWPRGASVPAMRRWVHIGLVLSLAGDVALMWPRGFLPGLVSFLLAHLAYIVAFTRDVRLATRPLAFAAYGLLAAAILWQLWPGVPQPLRAPVLAYVICLAAMAAQAAVRWLARRGSATEALARSAAVGGALFLCSDSLLAFNKFSAPLPLAELWVLATYWAAQFLIARSLPAAPAPTCP
jgi:uncharacterized membrane protein YhhN